MRFSQSLYFGHEMDGLVQIDILISNPSSVDITLLVSSDDSDASSEGILYLHKDINHTHLFCAQVQTMIIVQDHTYSLFQVEISTFPSTFLYQMTTYWKLKKSFC